VDVPGLHGLLAERKRASRSRDQIILYWS